MGVRRPYSEVEAERAKYPLGKPAPYRPGHKNYLDKNYMRRGPNRIPFGERVWNTIVSLLLLAYGGYGIGVNDLYFPKRRGGVTHFHDIAAISMFVAMCFATAILLAVVIDHYDTRDNEIAYRRFANVAKYAGLLFFVLAFVLHVLSL